jgi:hypothetical protein
MPPTKAQPSMPATDISFSSPKLAAAMTKVFGNKAGEIKVEKRANKDVARFLKRIDQARRKAADSSLQFP